MKILEILTVFCFVAGCAQTPPPAPVAKLKDGEQFTDRVTDFGTDSGYVSVLFSHQAAGYKISMERDDFAEQIGNLAAAWKSGKPVKVVVGGVEIHSISTP